MDFTKRSIADIATSHPDVNAGTTGSLHQIDWETEDTFWRGNYASRPYASADRSYDHYRPAYQYGAEARARHGDRNWNDVEPELERGWTESRGESTSTWHEMKDAVRDAWDRVTGHPHHT